MGYRSFTDGERRRERRRARWCWPEGRWEGALQAEVTWELPRGVRAGRPWGHVKMLESWPFQIISIYVFSLYALKGSKFTHQTYKWSEGIANSGLQSRGEGNYQGPWYRHHIVPGDRQVHFKLGWGRFYSRKIGPCKCLWVYFYGFQCNILMQVEGVYGIGMEKQTWLANKI